ncbi:hypothetical protein VTI28DRAFT_3171 [Corynascus sepedonium]
MRSVPIFGVVAIVLRPAAAAADQSTSTSANPSTSPTSPSSVRVFLDPPYARNGLYAASVASACKDQTIYALQCTSYPNNPDASDFCGPDAPTFTVTERPSTFIASYGQMITLGDQVVSATTVETCHITPAAAVTCINSWNVVASAGAALPQDWPTGGTGTVINPATSSYYYQVAVTAGGDKLASATDACKPAATNVAVGVEPRESWAVTGALVAGILGLFVW